MGKFRIIDELEPAGDFKIAQSSDIAYNDKSVGETLDDLALVAEQVAANTPAIEQNTSDISEQSGKIETLTGKVTAAETAIAGKASAEAVTQLQTEMDVQKARMDQLVEDPEVGVDEIADARIDNTGKTYANLGDHIRGTETSLKETIGTISARDIMSGNLILDTNFTQVNNKAWVTDKTEVSGGGYLYRIYPMSGIKKISVTGHSWGNKYPLVCFYDASGNLLKYDGEQYDKGGTQYTNAVITVPNGADKCYVNGQDIHPTELYYYDSSTLDERIKTVETELKNEFSNLSPYEIKSGNHAESTDYTQIDGKAWETNKSEVSGGAYYYRIYAVGNTDKVAITGHSWGGRYPLVCFYDINGTLLNYEGEQYDKGDTQYTDVVVYVPKNADKCYVNGQSSYPAALSYFTDDNLEGRLKAFISSPSAHIKAFDEEGSNYDADKLKINTSYRLYINRDGYQLSMRNLPYTVSKGTMAVIVTLGSDSSFGFRTQIYIDDVGNSYFRYSSNVRYSEWVNCNNNSANHSIYINPDDDVVGKFIEAITNDIKDVYINSGDYDVMALYKKHYGDNFFDNYTGYTSGDHDMGRGIVIKNGIHYHFATDAYFHADNTGNTNTNVKTFFSMFAPECGRGYTIDGLNITECKNLRYAVHDDFSANESKNSGVGEYINCHIISDDRCIGAGLHNGATLKMTDSVFIQNNDTVPVHVHTPNIEGHKGQLIVTGCYFSDRLQIGKGGNNTAESTAFVSNCSLFNFVKEPDSPWNVISFNINTRS